MKELLYKSAIEAYRVVDRVVENSPKTLYVSILGIAGISTAAGIIYGVHRWRKHREH